VTYRFTAPETDERDFQESVVRHLGLREWITFDLGEDGDFLSPTTCSQLLAGGPMWPPAPLTRAGALRGLDGGLWLTGEGGDEVLGPRRVSYAVRAARSPRRRVLSRAVRELGSKAMRIRATEAEFHAHYRAEWLEPDIRRHYIRDAAALSAAEPLRPREWFGHYLARPAVKVGHEALRAFKSEFGLRWEAPLVDPFFLGALSGSVRWHEYRGRRHLLRTLFNDLLPAAIVERRGKVAFNSALFGPYTREFAARWDGTGAPEGVNGEWLKRHWQSGDVSAGTAPLLHHVWLATQRRRSTRDGARCR